MNNKSSAVAEMGDHLATVDMGRKVERGLLCPFPWTSGSPSNTMLPGLRTRWHLDPFNRLAIIHQRYRQRQTDKTGQRSDTANHFTNGRSKLHKFRNINNTSRPSCFMLLLTTHIAANPVPLIHLY